MNTDSMGWVEETDKERNEEIKKGYFNLVEGDNRCQLLTHCAKLVQVWDTATKKFRTAKEGDEKPSIKGLCWVLHDGLIKEAKLPYAVVKQIQELRSNADWAFDKFPMPRIVNIIAKDNGKQFNGKKVLDYTVMPSPKETAVSKEILAELAKKPTPEAVVEKIKERGGTPAPAADTEDDE